ncbi:M91 family zinc metallopeptidase [Pseudomonas sp. TAE6080]|uniref:M91 family zinc metallopeptidase n=1 Tax=Pseudomonas sp. TAE6080 TaxID=2840374 RepID=UPI001C0036A3|nr:M91 family zinc metallopeptidase [Pseudomonas sp. TAE6080]MBT9303771.1 hypothetical protein [Pseudomonas sp. TAE6080]
MKTSPPTSTLPIGYPTAPPTTNTTLQDPEPHIDVLANDGNAKIMLLSTHRVDPHSKSLTPVSRVLINTSYRSDKIHISADENNQLNASINGKDYKLPLYADNQNHSLRIKADGGDDHISIDKRISIEMHIDGGDGDDFINIDGNANTVQGGKGNDYIQLGRGHTVAFGGDGNDIMVAGTGNAVMSGGKGNDRLFAGAGPADRLLFLNGDRGNDQLYAGPGKVVLNGGLGDDTLAGYNQTTFYTGQGVDTVYAYNKNDKIYAKSTDNINANAQAKTTILEYAESGKIGLKIEGTEQFIEQTEDIIEQLRGSPTGQHTLKEMDRFVNESRAPITLTQSRILGSNSYNFRNKYRDEIPDNEYKNHQFRPELGFINNNQPGSVSTHPEIAFLPDHFEKDFSITPQIALHHELAHAFNGATGTFIPGEETIKTADGKPILTNGAPKTVAKAEYQAIGLPTDSTPFDFDNDPSTPAITTNPAPFTENALREEMGVPLRDRYDIDEAPRIG